MIQDIHPRRLDMTFRQPAAEDNDYVVAIRKNKILLLANGDAATIPTVAEAKTGLPGAAEKLVYLFSVDGRGVHLCLGEPGEGGGFGYRDIMGFREFRPEWLAFAGMTASHLGQWYAANRFCGGCGTPMEHKKDERAMQCGSCGAVIYPRISPAVIAGVTNGDSIIMTRYANRPNNAKMTALIAGFMEVGETLEETVRREVMEEVGVRVKNIRYYKSQPWAFSGSILVGFYADLDGAAEITIDPAELQEAAWVKRDDIPAGDNTFSLTAEMVETFRRNEHPKG